jgi:hypothetical protein
MAKLAILGPLLAAVALVSSCSGSSSPATTTGASATLPRSSAGTPHSIAPQPRTFTSKAYGYTVTVPAHWTSRQSFAKWDGESELDGDSAFVDLLGQPAESRGVWAAAARSRGDLATDTTFAMAWNTHFHGDTCPGPPTRTRVTVGGRPGVLLAYDCGILVDFVVTIERGIEYWFVFVDQVMPEANDRADRATFAGILKSVRFPH